MSMIAQPVFSKSPRTSVTSVNSIKLYSNSNSSSSAAEGLGNSASKYTYTSYSDYTASLKRDKAQPSQSMTDAVRQSNKAAILAVGEELRILLHEEDPPMIKDRRFHLRSYPQSFVGSEMVDWLLKKGEVETRAEAVQMMQKLVDYGVMHHGEAQVAQCLCIV